MEYSKQICWAITQINHLNFGQKTELKQTMTHVKRITPIVKLNLRLQC